MTASTHSAADYADDDYGFSSEDRGGLRSAISFEKIRSTLFRNRWVIVGAVVAGLLASLAVTVLTRPKYTAAASIQIDQQAAKVLDSQESDPLAAFQDADRFLQTQIDVLKSRSIAERVNAKLRLDQSDAFAMQMGQRAGTPALDGDQAASRRERAVALLMKNLKVDLPRNSRVATIEFVSPTPALAARVANTFADQFIFANLQRRFEATSYARDFLQGRLVEVRRRLENSERQANQFARRTGFIDASNAASGRANTGVSDSAGPKSLTVARLVELNAALVRAQIARTEAEERWAQAQRTPLMSLSDVLTNGGIQELRQQRAQLAAAYEEEKQRRRDAYPTMVQQAARLTELDQQITRMAQDVRRSISDAYQTALAQERETAADVAQAERETRTEQDRGVDLNILRREVDTNRELYDGLLQRFKELSAEAGVTNNNISIVDRARVPTTPTSPKLNLNLAIGLLLGLVAAAAIVIAREMFDDRIRLPEEVPVKLGLPLMGSIPGVPPTSSPRAQLEEPKSELAEAYQALRATLELSTSRGVPASVLVTSSRPSEGKSTTAYAIARTFARQGRSVTLVDGDLRRPSVHKLLGFDNDRGLSTLLSGQQSLVEVIRTTEVPGLSVVTSGPIPADPAQLLQRDTVTAMVGQITASCDLLVLDAPPVLGLADALELAAAVEGVLFVVEAGSMHFGGVRASIKRLRDVRASLLGVVLNKFDAKAIGYSTNYSYAYTYKYGSTPKS